MSSLAPNYLAYQISSCILCTTYGYKTQKFILNVTFRRLDLHGACIRTKQPADKHNWPAPWGGVLGLSPCPAGGRQEHNRPGAAAWCAQLAHSGSRPGRWFSKSRLLICALNGPHLSAHFPRWGDGHCRFGRVGNRGELLPEALDHYGAFDDMVIIALGPLLDAGAFSRCTRFAAAKDKDRAALLVGDIDGGKTTTGFSLLSAGWKLVFPTTPPCFIKTKAV